MLIIIIPICKLPLQAISGEISNFSFLKSKTENNILKNGIFKTHSNSYIVNNIPITVLFFRI
jgi:hypothetical protein